ncbi:MAG: elongation factor EF-2 [archaeon]|nr:elongation factor EF-2 [archaeon]MDD2477454.1 elongation factor EF-2 [Candidatus ainarchaeum sp.]MDD3084737.1 elongation factor EF-2 [Candidatus ainarchaeum sp.]MDD4220986.1 elongation factor EF-2 [Candidatus ainarchaeum sp.]MDD4662442.1 elongation factor EF-2 [Candidatus ainarchaeum sp.]
MGRKEQVAELAEKLMANQKNIRNIAIIAHIDHGKSTLTDNLVATAGLISKDLAGEQVFMDSYVLEQERGITINSSNVSVPCDIDGEKFLINIIDTPGHVDFTGDVIRAMRAVDGAVLVVDAVEGVMPQTETVLRQALRERVKPVLFINKVDRLITEMHVTPEDMQQKFIKIVMDINNLITKNAPDEFRKEWQVNIADGSVCFGTGFHNWALSVPAMKKYTITFKDIIELAENDRQKELGERIPISEVFLEMVAKHLPNPIQSQKYRIPVIWKGDPETAEGKAMLSCDAHSDKVAMMVTDVVLDKHAGDIASGRIYSGVIKKGMELKVLGSEKIAKVQQVGIYLGPEKVLLDEVKAGNIAAIIGMKEVYAGQTISSVEMEPFEDFMTDVEPVMTVSIEAKNSKDLPKLIDVIHNISKEDPNIKAELNQDTGEHLISGMGELHLEITQYKIEKDNNIPITVSPPIVVYYEAITKASPVIEGKTPNKHNKFKITVEPIEAEILENLRKVKHNGKLRPNKDLDIVKKLQEAGFSIDDSKNVWVINNHSVLINRTKGIQNLNEVRELIIEAFIDATNEGPVAKEKVSGIVVSLEDVTLHEDAIHRGPAQVLPAMTRAIYAGVLYGDYILLEPKQKLTVSVPQDFMGAVSKVLSSRRAQIEDIKSEGDSSIFTSKIPVKSMIGFSQVMRGDTQGRAVWSAEYYGYEPLPKSLQKDIITEIRTRKGMDPEPKSAEFFID